MGRTAASTRPAGSHGTTSKKRFVLYIQGLRDAPAPVVWRLPTGVRVCSSVHCAWGQGRAPPLWGCPPTPDASLGTCAVSSPLAGEAGVRVTKRPLACTGSGSLHLQIGNGQHCSVPQTAQASWSVVAGFEKVPHIVRRNWYHVRDCRVATDCISSSYATTPGARHTLCGHVHTRFSSLLQHGPGP
jgi:hypothetical protein